MMTRLVVFWGSLRDSLWLIPTVLAVAGIALAFFAVGVDSRGLGGGSLNYPWDFGGGVAGARGVLSTIAGSIITVTGVVFSITVVALQLASSQFTPRALSTFTGDRVTQVVLGLLIGTFAYSLVVLRTVRSASSDFDVFVPSLSVTIAIGLALACIGGLVFFIDHTSQSIQPSFLIARIAGDTIRRAGRLFPEPFERGSSGDVQSSEPASGEAGVTEASETGYVLGIDEAALLDLAASTGMTAIRAEVEIGAFVLSGAPIVSVWPASALSDGAVSRLRRAVAIGWQRSPEHDVELGIRQIVDIALRALSPGVNDPTTARLCIDHLSEVIVFLGGRAMPRALRVDPRGQTLLVGRQPEFEAFVAYAFSEIRHFGAGTPSVAAQLVSSFRRAEPLLPAQRRPVLRRELEHVLEAARRSIESPVDLAVVESAAGVY
jgi:uncharacterized membrane protein